MDIERASPGLPGAQVLRLDAADARWQVDLELNDVAPGGLKKYQAVSALQEVQFTIDQNGQRLPHPVQLLLAGVWKRDVGLDVFFPRDRSRLLSLDAVVNPRTGGSTTRHSDSRVRGA